MLHLERLSLWTGGVEAASPLDHLEPFGSGKGGPGDIGPLRELERSEFVASTVLRGDWLQSVCDLVRACVCPWELGSGGKRVCGNPFEEVVLTGTKCKADA